MEKVWRILYSPAFFWTAKILNCLALLTAQAEM
jgi:hypothetical protein